MPVVCTTSQFTANGGILGLDRSAQSRVVVEATQASTGDGPVSGNPGVPGKQMINQRVHWVNDYGVTVQIQVQLQRARRTMYLSAPNYLFIRERYTWATGVDSPSQVLAPEPDVTSIWQTEWGGGIDVGVKSGVPIYGHFRQSMAESTLFVPLITLNAGLSVDVRFRASVVNPYQWWDNAPPVKVQEIYAFSNTTRIVAYPDVV